MFLRLEVLLVLLLLSSVADASSAPNDLCHYTDKNLPTFSCPSLPTPPPASDVRHLRPGNIGAVLALGDSITAGFGEISTIPLEFRGDVYSTGGNKNMQSLAHFLMNYNGELVGSATGTTIPLTTAGKGLNFAVSGAKVQDVPGQITRLVEKIDSDYPQIKDEWKLLTLFIGANNLCEACFFSPHTTAPYFEEQLRLSLTMIRQKIPKTFVNLITIFNVSQVWDAAQGHSYCKLALEKYKECNCVILNDTTRNVMDNVALQYNAASYRVAQEFQMLNDPEFFVQIQPGVEKLPFAGFDQNFLSCVDCFHPSYAAHRAFALAFWNNMFAPPDKKQDTLNPSNPPPFYCPTENDFIQ